jgi:hypothetical protein
VGLDAVAAITLTQKVFISAILKKRNGAQTRYRSSPAEGSAGEMAHVTLKIVLYAATDGDLERHAVREHSRLRGLAMAANRGRPIAKIWNGVVAVTARSRPAPSPGRCRAEPPTAPSP